MHKTAEEAPSSLLHATVTVRANDYSYCGKVVAVFRKKSGALRCVVEDRNGRLFIHNIGQIFLKEKSKAKERAPGIDPKTGQYSTAQMLWDEMTMGDTSKPLFD